MSHIRSLLATLPITAVLLIVPAASARAIPALGDSSGGQTAVQLMTARLTASDGVAGNALGISIAVSGNTVVVGEDCLRIGNNPNCDTKHQGVVYVYQKPQAGWGNMVQTAKLTPSDGYEGDEFGTSVAINGNTIVVGAGNAKAYVFVKPLGRWKNTTESAQLTDGMGGDGFGELVAVNKGTIVVGAPLANVGGNQSQGAAYVFVEPATGWATTSVFDAQLTASNGTFQDVFGIAVAVSGDTVAVGAHFHQGQTGPGKVYVFTMPATGWVNATETAKLTRANPGPYDEFGLSLAIYRNTIVVGAPQAVGADNGQGTVDVFMKPSTGWNDMTETAELVAPVFIQHFGFSVAISGPRVVVGTFSPDKEIFVYAKPIGKWKSTSQPEAQLTAGSGISFFGFSVAMTSTTIVAGAPYQSVGGHVDQGAAYIFSQ